MITNGAFGVDLFFCISGFIMMHVTEKSSHRFLAKRVIRVVPLYWFTTFTISAILIFRPDLFRTTLLTTEYFIKSILFIPYYYTGQSGQTFNSINMVGWTLIMEVFFYFLFFVAMKINHKYRHYIATAILALMAIIGITTTSDNTLIRFYCSPIMLEFSLGMFGYRLLTRSDIKKRGLFAANIALFVATLIWACLFMVTYIPQFIEIERFMLYGLPAFAVFILVFKAFENRTVPRPLIVLGNISYSLYLSHAFVVQGFSRLIYDIDVFSPLGVVLIIVAVIPLTIIVGWVSWWLIEDKFTEWLKKRLRI